MKLNEWIQANWKALLLCIAILLLIDVDIQLHLLNTRSRQLSNAVRALDERVANVEDSTSVMQDDLDEITGHAQSGDDTNGDNGNSRN